MKLLLFSHRSDNDGITPVILSKLVFDEVTVRLEEPTTIDESFNKMYEEFDQYDFIFVTDLCINEVLANQVLQDPKNKNKVKIFDHHSTNEDKNKYPFITVISSKNGKMECASSLYYEYLLTYFPNSILKKDVVKEMVEKVRLLDTWQWQEQNDIEAKWLGNLFGIYGKEYYIDYYYQFCLKEDRFSFNEKQKYLLEIEDIRIQNYIQKKEKEIYLVELQGYKVGVVFAELYRSELGNTLAQKYQDTYDFFAIINISRSVSYRGVKDIHLGKFAQFYKGAGHKNAAGSSLPDHLLEDLIQLIFKT